MRARVTLIAVLMVAGAACGNSREEDALDEAEAICLGLTAPGTTVVDAGVALRGAYGYALPGPPCDLLALPSNDTCAPAPADGRCAGFWYFITSSVCSPTGGCCGVCEVRVLQSDVSQNGGDAAVCASAFYRRQLCR